MRALYACITFTLASSAVFAEPYDERVKKLFKSDNYRVSWGAAYSRE